MKRDPYMKRLQLLLLCLFLFLLLVLTACQPATETTTHAPIMNDKVTTQAPPSKPSLQTATKELQSLPLETLKQQLTDRYQNQKPKQWGERVNGVINRLNTEEKVIALTFDACGGPNGSGYDAKLIEFLKKEQIPATLFVNGRWIDANRSTFMQLAKNPLFEIENHGYQHKPLSVQGRSIYGIKGTKNIAEIVDEVVVNERKIEELTGRKPKFFRSGTAFYDDVAVRIVHETGEQVVNFDVIGDAGATYNVSQVRQALLHSKPGSIVILHFNKPSKDTAEGVIQAIPELKKKGFRFVKLEEVL